MQDCELAKCLCAVGHETRLAIVRILIAASDKGLSAGDIRDRVDIPAPTLSHHLRELTCSGIINSERDGRSIYYSANRQSMKSVSDAMEQLAK